MSTRNLKNVAKSANQPTSKEMGKIRKQYKDFLSFFETKMANGEIPIENMQAAQQFRDSLKDTINDSYAIKSGENKGSYTVSANRLERSLDFAKEVIDTDFSNESLRKNELFQRDINQASIGGVSTKSKEEVKVFYAATKNIWGGKDITKRNEALMKHFGVETIEEVWTKVFNNEEVKKALEEAKANQREISNENEIANGANDEKERKGSPPYIKDLVLTIDTKRINFLND